MGTVWLLPLLQWMLLPPQASYTSTPRPAAVPGVRVMVLEEASGPEKKNQTSFTAPPQLPPLGVAPTVVP